MKKALVITLTVCLTANVVASESTIKNEKNAAEANKLDKPFKRKMYSIDKAYKAEKLVCKQMEMMDAVFVVVPMCTVRLYKAAVETKKLLEEIDKMKPLTINEKTGDPIYFEKKDDEVKFIHAKIKAILDPIDKFLEEALEKNGPIVRALFDKIFGEDAKYGFLLPAISSGQRPSIYLQENMTSIKEFVSGISEFWIFFSVINASLSDDAKKAYSAKLKELQVAQQKNNANNRENNKK